MFTDNIRKHQKKVRTMFKVNIKETKTSSMRLLVLVPLLLNVNIFFAFILFIFFVDFEQVNVYQDNCSYIIVVI